MTVIGPAYIERDEGGHAVGCVFVFPEDMGTTADLVAKAIREGRTVHYLPAGHEYHSSVTESVTT